MGAQCCPGTPNQEPPLSPKIAVSSNSIKQDIFSTQRLQKITMNNKYNYYWIDPNINNNENSDCLKKLKQINQITGYNSVAKLITDLRVMEPSKKCKIICAASLKDQEFQTMQNQFRLESIYLYCQNKQRAQSLMSTFPKIKTAFYDFQSFKTFLGKQKEVQANFNLFFLIEDHMSLMNKYRINFYAILNSKFLHEKAKSEFINFAKKFYPRDSIQIETFQNQFNLNFCSPQRDKQTLNWLAKPGFFYDSIMKLPKMTSDPKKLANIRLPFKEAYDCIFKQNTRKSSNLSEAFVVIVPSEQEKERFKNNQRNFVMFTSFIKGFSQEKKAKDQAKKVLGSIIIRILIGNISVVNPNLDFGYCFMQNCSEREDVIFNVNNIFEIKEANLEERQVTLQYGSLASLVKSTERACGLNNFQTNLLQNYYYLQDIFKKINSQASVLSMSGHYKDSLDLYIKKGDQIRQTNIVEDMDRNSIDKGDAYCLSQNFQMAEKQYLSVKGSKKKLVANVHLAQMYLKTKQTAKFDKLIEEISSNISDYKKIQPTEDSFKAQNLVALQLMNKDQFKQASRMYKILKSQMNQHYKFKFEGIPLVHEIMRNRAACETKLKNYTQALNLLESTKQWQIVCGGTRSPDLIMTQNLIKSVHKQTGRSTKAEECTKQIKKILQNSSKTDIDHLTKRAAVPQINQSAIDILVTGNTN